MDDTELISKVVNGDQRAFMALYDRYSSRVYALVLRMMRDEMMAEEVMQDTFLKLWDRARQYLTERGPRCAFQEWRYGCDGSIQQSDCRLISPTKS